MALPPNDAYLPTTTTAAAATPTTTFGQLRQVHVESTSKGTSIPMGSIGCSSANSKMVINTSRRALAGEEGEHNEEEGEDEGHGVSTNQCAEDELFCWFRCMAIAEEHKNCDAEPERNLALQCVNPRGQVLKDGLGHGDYFPGEYKKSPQQKGMHTLFSISPGTKTFSLSFFNTQHAPTILI